MVIPLNLVRAQVAGIGFAFFCLGSLMWDVNAQEALASTQSALTNGTSAPPATVDLRPAFEKWGLTARRQGKRGTCSVFTVVGALEFAAAQRQRHGERLSVEFLNWGANRIVGDDRDGGFFSDLCRAFDRYGICSEDAMPYEVAFDPALAPTPQVLADAKARLALGLRPHWIKEWNVRTGLTDSQFTAIRHTLSQGWPVCAGLRWPRKPKWNNGILEMCPAEAVFDGHSVLLVGYRDDASQLGGGVLLFRNTGDDGHDGSMPYTFARTYMNDAVWMDFGEAGPPN